MPRDDVSTLTTLRVLCENQRRSDVVLTVKDFAESIDYFEFSGIATTPQVDRMGDIVEPRGAQFNLPVKLLSKHDSTKPIGEVYAATVSKTGIAYKARIPKVKEPGIVQDRVNEAIHEVKYHLVSNVSIGFQPIADAVEALKNGGLHFLEWIWLELSLAPIPANDEATITSFKALDTRMRAALREAVPVKAFDHTKRGIAPASCIVRLATAPDVSGTTTAAIGSDPPTRSKGAVMATIHERINKWEAKRQADVAARSDILKKAEDDGDRTLTVEEKSERDRLTVELREVDEHLVALREEAEIVKSTASAVTRDAGGDPDEGAAARGKKGGDVSTILMRDNLPKEMAYVRHVKCQVIAKLDGMDPLEVAKERYPDMPRLHNVLKAQRWMGMNQKASVTSLQSGDAAGGGALAQFQLYSGDFVTWLRPQTIIGQFGQNGIPSLRQVPFMVSIASQTSGGSGYWVGEGKPKPLTTFGFARTTLGQTKCAGIAVVTEEELRASTPSADQIVRDALAGAVIERIDRDFIDPDSAGTSNVQPASITYGASGSAVTGTNNAAVATDFQTLFGNFLSSNINPQTAVLIMSAKTALALSLAVNSLGQKVNPDITVNGGRLNGIPVIVSQYADFGGGNSPATGGLIVLVNAGDIWLADDGQVNIAASNEASLQMLDNPTNDSVTPTATTMVSMYQTDSVAIRAERYINWSRRRSAAVAYLTGVAYNGQP